MSARPSRASGALAVTLGIVASRVAGFARQAVIAHVLGVGAVSDAVVAAFRIGNVAQNLVGEGAISASLVPEYVQAKEEDPLAAAELARGALGALCLAVVGLSALGMLLTPQLTSLFAAGIEGEARELAIELTRIAFPMTALLVLSAWALAILSAHKRFLLAYTAPVLWSAAQIVALVGARIAGIESSTELARSLMFGAIVGAALQLAFLSWPTRRWLHSLKPSFDFSGARLRRTLSRVPATLLGRGVMQLSGLVDTSLVTLLGAGALSTFQNAQTAYLLPMAVLGTGEAAALLPSLAGAERKSLSETMGPALRRVAGLGLGAALVFIALSDEVVGLLFERGAFDAHATKRVASVLSIYGLGLLANALGRMMSTACYAAGDTRSPARLAIVRVGVSTAGSLLLMRWYGVEGVVLGAVLGGVVEASFLARRVNQLFGETGLASIPWLRLGLASVGAVSLGLGLRFTLAGSHLGPTLHGLLVLTPTGLVLLVAFHLLGLFRRRAAKRL